MYAVTTCTECGGVKTVYERCPCGQDNDCPFCYGFGEYEMVCPTCSGAGVIDINTQGIPLMPQRKR